LPVTATVDEVRAKMRERTREEWLAQCAGADVCLTTVYERDEVANDPHVIARGVASQRERHAPKNMDSDRRSAPALGADTDALLDAAGIDRDARERLRAAGTI